MTQPTQQHYRNPLKWGWYYVAHGDEAETGLMTKNEARRYIKSGCSMYGYGRNILKRTDTPRSWFKKRFTLPKNSG